MYFWADAPTQRGDFLKHTVEAFAPGLGVMLASVFAKKKTSRSQAKKPPPPQKPDKVEIIALFLSAIYIVLIVFPVVRFCLGKIEAMADVNEISAAIRPSVSWLVVPVIAFYFGAKPE